MRRHRLAAKPLARFLEQRADLVFQRLDRFAGISAVEFALGRLVLGYSWARIGAEYNLLKGGLMPIGLLVLTLSPLTAARWRGLNKPPLAGSAAGS